MDVNQLENFIGGWFIGDFEPSLLKTGDFEVGVKFYRKGDYEKKHYHLIATEFTIIIEGEVKMNGLHYLAGSIIKIFPGESTDFEALTDVKTLVVKTPSAKNDKYVV